MRPPLTRLADIPETFESIVGDADGRIWLVTAEFVTDANVAWQKPILLPPSDANNIRIPVLPATMPSWENAHPFDPVFEYDAIDLQKVVIYDRYVLRCGYSKRAGKWLVKGDVMRIRRE